MVGIVCDANTCLEDYENESLVPEGTDACGDSQRSFHMEVKKCRKGEWIEKNIRLRHYVSLA